MKFKNYYKILSVKKKASDGEIKKAYRLLAKKWHPDVNPDNAKAEEMFKEIAEAYDILSDSDKRKKFDNFLFSENKKQQYTSHSNQYTSYSNRYKSRTTYESESDIFKDIFKKRTKHSYFKGDDLRGKITIDLEEAYNGSTRIINNGDQKLRIKIKAGIKNEHIIKIREKGTASKFGGQKGDLYIRVVIKEHSNFKRKGNDLHASLNIPIFNAITGDKVSFKSLTKNISVNIPPLFKSGQKIRLKGEGMPTYENSDLYGDLYLTINHIMPTNLSEKDIRLLNELKKK